MSTVDPRHPIARRELDAAGIEGAALRESYLRCRAINAAHGKTYFLATALLPPAKRPFVHALYGFARRADDIVDDTAVPVAERGERLQAWCGEFLADLDWGATSDPVSRAVLDTVTRFDIPTSYFVDFVEAMRWDLDVTSYATYAELEQYMWGSAAVIGLQMLPVLGRRDDAVRWDVLESHAIALGTAFQLTNFVRDVGEDLRRGRVYLPQESLDQFGVDLERLRRGVVDEAIRSLLAWEIERARGLYAKARPGLALVHPTSRDCLQAATTLYGEILDEIEHNDYDVFRRRAHVGAGRRAAVGLSGLRGALRARRHSVPEPNPPTPRS
ncbi:phytoene synthase [Jatrophihabitans endophyticus]|uniref:Phytoene synthase n=1 Tax=Jatrophihabitans endophyticus TaxID=1206085 RepID=A0A1M5L6G3_9ACTN|nr:phytoene/squalene synthase family protein [Jatrophihabitans endophyticus]SHG60598.1 phytoene synthase [Jatrophihabitans endophyticus]